MQAMRLFRLLHKNSAKIFDMSWKYYIAFLKEKKDNLRKLRNYLMHGSFYFEYENNGNIPEIVLTDNEGQKNISFIRITNLYNEIVSVIFMLNSKKTSSEKAEDCRLEYALFNNMNKISRLIKSDVFTKYEEYNPGYSYYYNDMTIAAVLVNFYAIYNYGLETIFGPNMATVGDEQDFLKRVIESEYVDFSEFNFDLMDVKVSKNVSLVRTMPNQRKDFAEDNIKGIINAYFTKITSGYIPEKYDYKRTDKGTSAEGGDARKMHKHRTETCGSGGEDGKDSGSGFLGRSQGGGEVPEGDFRSEVLGDRLRQGGFGC